MRSIVYTAVVLPGMILAAAFSGTAAEAMSKTVAEFADASVARQWRSVNDNVMGGVSEGGLRITADKTLEFSGNLSLKNRGGFTSIRTNPADLNLDGYDAIAVRLKGDGRSYYLNLMDSEVINAASYRAPIETEKDVWKVVRVNIRDFAYTIFGRTVPLVPVLKARDIRSVGITLADNKAGPFRLEIEWIKAEKEGAAKDAPPASEKGNPDGVRDIVDTAVSAGRFKTLVAALKAAGLVETLKAPGPFTVFAPTDEAFGKLPAGTLESLLKEENRDQLKAILAYHVVSGEITLGRLRIKSLQGGPLDISPAGDIRVEEARVLLADVRATNGIVHVIDRVLLPELSEPTPVRKAVGVIELAIERGVPLFNDGKPEACAAIYEVAAKSLLEGYADALDHAARERLRKALTGIRNEHRASQQAWILRYALDDVYGALREKETGK